MGPQSPGARWCQRDSPTISMMAQPAKTIALQVRRGTMAAMGARPRSSWPASRIGSRSAARRPRSSSGRWASAAHPGLSADQRPPAGQPPPMERGWPSLPPRRSSRSPGGLLPWLLGAVGLGVGARRPIHDLWSRTAMPRVTTPTARPVLVLTGQPRTTAGPPRHHQNDNGDQCGDDHGDDDGHAYPSDARRPDSALHVSEHLVPVHRLLQAGHQRRAGVPTVPPDPGSTASEHGCLANRDGTSPAPRTSPLRPRPTQ
jgi:hypothetical protein